MKLEMLISGSMKRKKNEREKPLLTKGKRQKVVRFLISPKKKKVKIEVKDVMTRIQQPIDSFIETNNLLNCKR